MTQVRLSQNLRWQSPSGNDGRVAAEFHAPGQRVPKTAGAERSQPVAQVDYRESAAQPAETGASLRLVEGSGPQLLEPDAAPELMLTPPAVTSDTMESQVDGPARATQPSTVRRPLFVPARSGAAPIVLFPPKTTGVRSEPTPALRPRSESHGRSVVSNSTNSIDANRGYQRVTLVLSESDEVAPAAAAAVDRAHRKTAQRPAPPARMLTQSQRDTAEPELEMDFQQLFPGESLPEQTPPQQTPAQQTPPQQTPPAPAAEDDLQFEDIFNPDAAPDTRTDAQPAPANPPTEPDFGPVEQLPMDDLVAPPAGPQNAVPTDQPSRDATPMREQPADDLPLDDLQIDNMPMDEAPMETSPSDAIPMDDAIPMGVPATNVAPNEGGAGQGLGPSRGGNRDELFRDGTPESMQRDLENLFRDPPPGPPSAAASDDLQPAEPGECNRVYNDRDCCAMDANCQRVRELLMSTTIDKISLDISPDIAPGAETPEEAATKRAETLAKIPSRLWRNREGRVVASGYLHDYRGGNVLVRGEDGTITPVEYLRLGDDELCFVNAWWGLPAECRLPDSSPPIRNWTMITYTWTASALCHKPTYFEDTQLERYGHSAGPLLQPLASGAHFFSHVALLPYNMGLQAPNECVYTLGHYRPGSCAPWLIPAFPLSAHAATNQALTVLGIWGVFH